MKGLKQFALLVWKGLLLRKRHFVVTGFELFLPMLMTCLFVIIRSQMPPVEFSQNKTGPLREEGEWKPPVEFEEYDPLPGLKTIYDGEYVLFYTPNNTLSSSLVQKVMEKLKIYSIAFQVFATDNEEQLEILLYNSSLHIVGNKKVMIPVAFVFKNFKDTDKTFPKSLDYKLRLEGNFMTTSKYPYYQYRESMLSDDYIKQDFYFYQEMIAQSFIELKMKEQSSSDTKAPKIKMHRFPFPRYQMKKHIMTFFIAIPYVIIYGYLMTVLVFVKRIVDEKANRAKEMMKMMGLNDFVYWGATFTNNFFLMFGVCAITAILYKIRFSSNSGAIIDNSDGFLFFIVLLLYTAAALLFCMAITTVCNRSVIAVVATLVLWVISHSIPSSMLDSFDDTNDTYLSMKLSIKLATCLLPNMALHWACKIMGYQEASGVGARWSNMSSLGHLEDNLTLSMIMGMLVLCCFIYSTLIWYVDNVWPFQYGVPLPLYYPFTADYWKRKCGKKVKGDEEERIDRKSKYFEADPPNAKPGIVLRDLTKVYGWGSSGRAAVSEVSMKIFSGEITALLGHNGAGKTTMMHMITGLYAPTSGTAFINGCNIATDTSVARSNLGLCPQHNVLYDTLTVEEHLKLFCGLKGVDFGSINEEIHKTLDFLQMHSKRKELSKNLSGGMKRKLSLGMAMIGGSKVLILDEPTSGMDPQARRAVWDMLQELRKEKTILLTTHYMEEADVLGDRIAIMATGRVQCYGSPLFLKKMFGAGYHLRLVKSEGFNFEKVMQVIKSHIPGVLVDNEINTEITLVLNAKSSEPLVGLFDNLEQRKQELGIVSCGLSITTMEDVFLKVGQLAEQGELANKGAKENASLLTDEEPDEPIVMTVPTKLEGLKLQLQIVNGLMLKRLHDSRRYLAYYVFVGILPLVLICLMVHVDQDNLTNTVEHIVPLNLSLRDVFGVHSIGVYNSGNTSEEKKFLGIYLETLKKSAVHPKLVDDPSAFVLDVGNKDLMKYKQEYLVGGSVYLHEDSLAVKAWFNGEALHVGAMSLNFMETAVLNYVTNSVDKTITVTNSPLLRRFALHDTIGNRISDVMGRIIYACFLPIALTFLSSSYVLFPVHERISKSKLLQLMTGLNPMVFWGAHFTWDFSTYGACSIVLILPFITLDYYGIFSGGSSVFGAIWFLLVMYGWSSIPLSYFVSFFAKTPSGGFTLLTILNILAGLISCMVMTVLRQSPVFADNVNIALWFLRLIPIFSVTWGVSNIHSLALKNSECVRIPRLKLDLLCPSVGPDHPMHKCCLDFCGTECFKSRAYLSWDVDAAGREVFFMFFVGCCFFGLVFLLETNFVKLWYDLKKTYNIGSPLQPTPVFDLQGDLMEDADVASERLRVEELHRRQCIGSEALVVTNLSKRFSNMYAVDHLTFAVHKKECFGFLGVNGAGKTTTFSMLTGDMMIDEGNAYIQSYNVKDDLHEFQTYIGYCPQFDALLDRLTGRESLGLFARLRGIPEGDLGSSISRLLRMVNLEEHADKISANYSGGNRRKLSLAQALIGAPPVVFLDEPTAGVDPAARRKIWEALMSAQRTGVMSFVLTTHSMEECEALCTRLAIMVNGKFRCLGATQHLKSKFGEGYTVIMKLSQARSFDTQAIAVVRQFVEQKFPMSSLKDVHQGTLTYHILDNSLTWSELFHAMEMAKRVYSLEDYLVSDTTLEQIFLTFARNQRIVTV